MAFFVSVSTILVNDLEKTIKPPVYQVVSLFERSNYFS